MRQLARGYQFDLQKTASIVPISSEGSLWNKGNALDIEVTKVVCVACLRKQRLHLLAASCKQQQKAK